MSGASIGAPLERAALVLVPARDRDALLGDLHEDSLRTTRSRVAAILGVGIAYQQEPYRDDRARVGVVLLLAAGFALLRVVPLAASRMEFFELDGLIWRAAAAVWGQGTAVAAAAAGLVVGRAPLMPEYAAHARWHVAAVLALAAAISSATWAEGVLGAALLIAGALLAGSARREAGPPNAAA